MRILKEAFAGIAVAITTSLLVMGAIVLAITEGMVLPTAEPVEEVTTLDPMQTMLFAFTTPTPPRARIQLVAAPTQPLATTCPTPAGWEAYTVLKGDTLRSLAEARQTSEELVVKNNCMTGTSLVPDTRLFLPPAPPPTPTPLTPTATFTPSCHVLYLPTSSRLGALSRAPRRQLVQDRPRLWRKPCISCKRLTAWRRLT